MNRKIFFRLIRAMIFVVISVLIIYIGIIPNDFERGSIAVHYILFAWVAAFTMRRPKSVYPEVLIFIALIYAVYIDEGMALGAFGLIAFALVVRKSRDALIQQSFILEVIALSLLFLLEEWIRSLLLRSFFTYYYDSVSILKYTIGFMIAYPFISALIYSVMRSRYNRTQDL